MRMNARRLESRTSSHGTARWARGGSIDAWYATRVIQGPSGRLARPVTRSFI
jgi:hypothetical protein